MRRYPHPSRLFFFCLHLFDEEHSAIFNNSSKNVITEHSETSSTAFSHVGGKIPVPGSDEVRDVPSTQTGKEGIILHNLINPLPPYLPTPIPQSFPFIPFFLPLISFLFAHPCFPSSLPSFDEAIILSQYVIYLKLLQTHQNTHSHFYCFFYFLYFNSLISLICTESVL